MSAVQREPKPQGVMAGVRWSAVTVFGRQTGALVTAFVLARLLGPSRYGVVTQAGVYLALVNLLLDQGLSYALIRRPRLEPNEAWSVMWMNVISASIITATTWVAAPIMQSFFHTPQLAIVLRALVPIVLLQAVAVVPEALMIRTMQFRRLAIVDLSSIAAGCAAGVIVALAGGGIWSAVAAPCLASIVVLGGFCICFRRSLRVGRPSIACVRDMRGFATNLLGFQSLNFASRNADNLVVARVVGPTALASYALSYRTMMLGVQSITMLVNRVMFPVYSKLQDDLPRLRSQFFSTTQLVALLTFPMMALVVVLAPTAVVLVFGKEWGPAVAPMQVLAITGLRQSVGALAGPVFMASGRTDWLFRWQLVSASAFVVSFLVGVHWGITGVAVAYSFTGLILQVPESWLVGRILNFSLVEYSRVVVPALAGATAAAGGAIIVLFVSMAAGCPPPIRLVAAACGGIGVHALLVRLLWPVDFESGCRAARSLLRREGHPLVPAPT